MDNDKMNLQTKILKKAPWLSFKELDIYFTNPDSQIQNTSAICAQQFIKDLDFIIDFPGNKLGLHDNIDESTIIIDTNTVENGKRHSLMNSLQKNGKLKLYKFINKLFKHKSPPETTVKIKSWNFTDFDPAEKFQVRKLYTIKPVSLTYNSTQQEYKYNKQIISEFCVEEANGNFKKLLIIDSIKNGKVKREKYIDGQNINRQYYHFEIRSHSLNRGLMKTFLFHQINKYKKLEYDQNNHLRYNNTNMGFTAAQPMTQVAYQTKGAVLSTPKLTEKFSVEYSEIPECKVSVQNQKKAVYTDYYFRNQITTAADNSIIFNQA